MDTIAPTPRNRLIGQLADLILGADQYAQKPDPALPNAKFDLADILQKQAGPARKQPIRP